ncbi:MAG: NfeD family protein [Prevotella sp.]|nr:NfeD family protein [Prevotella sp.]
MEWIAENAWIIWAVAAVLCVIFELMSGGLVLLCFAVGAAVAAIVSPFMGIAAQLAVFVVATIVSLAIVKKYFARRHDVDENVSGRVSNADALIGRRGKANSDIRHGDYGWVAIDGDVWKSKLADDITEDIPMGAIVEVLSRDSIILTVKPV